MPSPVGHSLIGLALAAPALLRPDGWRDLPAAAWRARGALLGAVFLANAPDLDYLPGLIAGDLNAYHHLHTHTLGWIALLAAGAWLLLRATGRRVGAMAGLLIFGLLASHLLADWSTADFRPPYGIMAFWPFSDGFFIARDPVFLHLEKADFSEFLRPHNFVAVARESLIGLPLTALGCLAALRRTAIAKVAGRTA